MTRALYAQRPKRPALCRRASRRSQFETLELRTLLAVDLDLGFDPVDDSATVVAPFSVVENQPFALPANYSQTQIQSRLNDPDLGDNLGQNALNESGPSVGRFLFTATTNTITFFDEDLGENVTVTISDIARTDLFTSQTISLASIAVPATEDLDGDGDIDADDFDPDFGLTLSEAYSIQNLRAVRWTPWGTLLVAEAIDASNPDFVPDPDGPGALSQQGIVYEIFNPTSSQPVVVARPQLGAALHMGIAIDSDRNVYLLDAVNSAVLQFVPDDPFSTSPLESGSLNVFTIEFADVGTGAWVPLDPFLAQENVTAALADALVGPSDLPDYFNLVDVEVGIGLEGGQVVYVATQGDDTDPDNIIPPRVIAIDLESTEARVFVDANTELAEDGGPVGDEFNIPLELSIDRRGRLYIGEGQLGLTTGEEGNDIWVAVEVDEDGDGFADFVKMDRLATLRTNGAVPAGLYVNPLNNNQIYVNASGTTSNNDRIFLLQRASSTATVEIITVGDEDILVINGSDNSDRIIVTGDILLTVRINDRIFRGLAPSTTVLIFGNRGNDTITVGSHVFFDFVIDGGPGADYIATGAADDVIFGGPGNDRILAGGGNNFVSGGDGNDGLHTRAGNDIIFGGNGHDRINSGAGNDFVDGGAGNDAIFGGAGDDFLIGGPGNDSIVGYLGNDILIGGSGNDFLIGGGGIDVLIGGLGADFLRGGAMEDLLIGERIAAEDDEELMRQLLLLWLDLSVLDSEARIEAFADLLFDFPITSDNARDLLDGEGGLDFIVAFRGRDVVRVGIGDDVVDPRDF